MTDVYRIDKRDMETQHSKSGKSPETLMILFDVSLIHDAL